jgi:hypothetical protein
MTCHRKNHNSSYQYLYIAVFFYTNDIPISTRITWSITEIYNDFFYIVCQHHEDPRQIGKEFLIFRIQKYPGTYLPANLAGPNLVKARSTSSLT